MANSGFHVAVAGNIGAGKTTLVTLLAKHYGWEPFYEAVDNNPYLEDFYGNMTTYAFPLQIFFLHSRFEQLRNIRQGDKKIIQDRTIYEDAYIFAKNLNKAGHINPRDYQTYLNLFHSMSSMISPPDLLIYLKSGMGRLIKHIEKRGRDYEEKISIGYLEELNQHYDDWIGGYKEGNLLVIDADGLDFAGKPEDFYQIALKVDAKMHGLFSLDSQK